MNWNRVLLKMEGKNTFQQNYGNCVLASLIVSLLNGIRTTNQLKETKISMPYGMTITANASVLLLSIFVVNVFLVGLCRFFIENRDYPAPVSKILFGFDRNHYGNIVLTMFLMDLKIFLWSCLFLIPGIVKMYEYRMVPYILAEQPDIPQQDAFAISREMMMNQKFETFIMDISFLGWYLLAAVTGTIVGIFWTFPYHNASTAELYAFLRDNWIYMHGNSQQGTTGGNF